MVLMSIHREMVGAVHSCFRMLQRIKGISVNQQGCFQQKRKTECKRELQNIYCLSFLLDIHIFYVCF